jgi:hypothetical protein
LNLPDDRSPAVVEMSLRNAQPSAVVLQLEPWGDEHLLEPGGLVFLRAESPQPGRLELEVQEGRVRVFAWPGCILEAFDENGELGEGLERREPVPEVPPGTTTFGFLGAILGNTRPKDET